MGRVKFWLVVGALAVLLLPGCGDGSGAADAGLDADAGPDAGGDGAADAGGDDGGVEDGDDGGTGDGGTEDGADAGFELAHGQVHLAGPFNGWAPAADGWAFEPVADHTWRLEAELPEGLTHFKLTTDATWDVALGWQGQRVAHHAAHLTLVPDGPQVGDVPMVCLYEGTYTFEYHDVARTLDIRFDDAPAPGPGGLGADPRAVENRALGAALLDGLVAGPPLDEQAIADVMAFGGAPLRGGQLLHFIAALPGQGGSEPIYLAGSHNGWDPTAQPMEPLVGFKLFYLGMPVPNDGLAYKLVYQGQWFADDLNPNVVWDGIEVAGVGTFNSTFPAPAAARTTGRLVRLWYTSQTMGNTRELFLHLPVAYDLEPQRAFPLMVVHDGNESLCRSQFDQVTDDEIAAGRVAPLIMALVGLPSQDERMDEYTFNTATSRGEQYRPFIADELLPFLDAELRLLPDLDQRAVMGASLGGLISFYIGWERPDAFGLVAGMSSSLFWDDSWMIRQVQQDAGPLKPLRFYLDSADVNDNHDETVEMAQALDARGYPHLHVVQAGASHDWFFWKDRFPGMLQYLFPAQ